MENFEQILTDRMFLYKDFFLVLIYMYIFQYKYLILPSNFTLT